MLLYPELSVMGLGTWGKSLFKKKILQSNAFGLEQIQENGHDKKGTGLAVKSLGFKLRVHNTGAELNFLHLQNKGHTITRSYCNNFQISV